ncbi:unnamed protein product, partial [Aureobasidium pullulans]
MRQLFLTIFLLALFSLASLTHSCRPSMWVVGLRENQTVGNHLISIGRPILSIENRPEIPGYTISVSENDTELIRAIRSDFSVGFVTKVSQNYFHKHEKFIADGWDEEDDEVYGDRLRPDYHWGILQYRDPEVFEGDDGGSFDEFINTITQLNPHSVSARPRMSSNRYGIELKFGSEEQERTLLRRIRDDYRVESITPRRCYTYLWYITYDKDSMEVDHYGQYNRYRFKFRSEEHERKYLPLMCADSRVEIVWPGRCHQPGCQLFTSRDGKAIPAWKDPCLFSLGYRQWEKTPVLSADSYPTVDFWGRAPYRSHETELPFATGYPWWLTR